MRTVQNMLDRKAPLRNIIHPDALVVDALHLMNTLNLSYCVVMDGDRFLGIFSERDYSRNVALKGRSSSNCPVRDAMSTDLPIVSPGDSVETCIHLILEHRSRYIPVCDEMQFVGVITMHDILRQALTDKELIFDDHIADAMLEGDGKIY